MTHAKASTLSPLCWGEDLAFNILVGTTADERWESKELKTYLSERFGPPDADNEWRLETSAPGFSLRVNLESYHGVFLPVWDDAIRNTYRREHKMRYEEQSLAWHHWLSDHGGDPMRDAGYDDDNAQERAASRLEQMEDQFLAGDSLKKVWEAMPTPVVDAIHAATIAVVHDLTKPSPSGLKLPTGSRYVDANGVLKVQPSQKSISEMVQEKMKNRTPWSGRQAP